MESERVPVHVLPGGKLPKRQTEGAIGFDVCARAIVSPVEMDPEQPNLRKTLFDFVNPPKDPIAADHVRKENGHWVYRMDPGESVLVGIGFVTAMESRPLTRTA